MRLSPLESFEQHTYMNVTASPRKNRIVGIPASRWGHAMTKPLSIALLIGGWFISDVAAADDWSQFRGPNSDNVATQASDMPTTWSESTNVIWKLSTSRTGWSSPIIAGDLAMMTEATSDGTQMYAFAVDLRDGKVRWSRLVFENDKDKLGETHVMNSYASPTPVTDGKHVWVHFGSYGTACLDVETGDEIWRRRDFPCNHFRGPGSSPMLDPAGRLFMNFDGYDFQYVVCLRGSDGSLIWKQNRDVDYGTTDGDVMKAFCTPIAINVDGNTQWISPTSKAVIAYDPNDGAELWRVHYDEFSATGQPFYDGKILYVNTGFGKAKLYAIDPRGSGDVTDTHVRWVAEKGIGSKPSQVFYQGLIYNIHDAGVLSCLDATDGAELWSKRLGGQFSASPLIAGGLLYVFDHDGTGYVIRPGRVCDLVAENPLDNGCMASPAVFDNSLIVRTKTAMYRIGKLPDASSAVELIPGAE